MNPLVTIVIPTYNHVNFLPNAIHSILQQTEQRFEIIVVNDGSTDNTTEILGSYHDPRIQIINNEHNIGLTDSWNKGMQQATGTYCCFLDADDTFPKESLGERLQAIGKADAVFSDITRFEQGREVLIPQPALDSKQRIVQFLEGTIEGFNLNIPSALFKRSIFSQIGYRTKEYSTHADFEFCLKILLHFQVKTVSLSTYNYIRHQESMSQKAYANEQEMMLLKKLRTTYAKLFRNSFQKK